MSIARISQVAPEKLTPEKLTPEKVIPIANPSSRPAIAPLPPESFHCGPHVAPSTSIAPLVWMLFTSSVLSFVAIVIFVTFTRTVAPPEFFIPSSRPALPHAQS
jgi:hypothetical protein